MALDSGSLVGCPASRVYGLLIILAKDSETSRDDLRLDVLRRIRSNGWVRPGRSALSDYGPPLGKRRLGNVDVKPADRRLV